MRPSLLVAKNTHPQPEPTTTIQHASTVIHATIPDTMPINTEILFDLNLFNAHITKIDKALNSFPNSSLPNPLTQLAPSTITETSILPFLNSTKSAIPSEENTDILTTTHTNTPYPIPDPHFTEIPPNFLEMQKTTTSPTRFTPTVNIGPLPGTWCKLGPPKHIMDTYESSGQLLGPKRKNHAEHPYADTLNDKKHNLFNDEAKTLGKLMVDNLGLVVVVW